ncbi:GTPase family protein [Natrialbaceae archaeon A-CW2]|uniref:GTPase family protein n=1 Tax=Natronosalvus amylolyticus TaxID=2961994 RepID=UPI0020C9BB5D|nr:GTPase [Natronosalvus amylolyticus]
MAVDPDKFKRFREQVDDIVAMAPGGKRTVGRLMDTAFGDALRETERLIDDSRPPRLYVFGRSGAGKSSLINALANKPVADVGSVEPTTVDSELYHVSFPDRYASWDVVDSRGLFESVSPDGDIPGDTISHLKADLEEYRPDIAIHVMTPDQVRAGKDDFATVETLRRELPGVFPPVVYCLNKVDTYLAPGGDWPPESNPSLAGDIKHTLEFVAKILNEEETTPFDESQPLHGYEFESDDHVGVVPVYLKEEPYWNVDTLAWLVGDFLPVDARLQFIQAQQREELMQELSRDVTKRFSGIAGGIGSAPTPGADFPVLTGLQLFLVGLIGSFSCRELERGTVEEYLTAMGGTTVAGLAARGVARSLAQLVPGVGQVVSGTVASATTYAVGRSAEEYFFNDAVVKPSAFVKKGKDRLQR